MKRTVTGLVDAALDQGGAFGFVSLKTTDGPLSLALPTEALHDLALLFLRLLGDGAKRGIVPLQLRPMMQPSTHLEASESGVQVTYEMSDGLCIESEMPWPVARKIGERLIALCNDHERGPLKPN